MTYASAYGLFGSLSGASADFSPAVARVQNALKRYSDLKGNADYDPGEVDGKYGLGTHAALIRVVRDTLEPAGTSVAKCRSTCNTLRLSALSFCPTCIQSWFYSTQLPGWISDISLTEEQIQEVVSAYKEWLTRWVSLHGEGGMTTPTVPNVAAESLVPEDTEEPSEVDIRQASAESPVQRAGFSWWWWILFGGIAIGLIYASSKGRK